MQEKLLAQLPPYNFQASYKNDRKLVFRDQDHTTTLARRPSVNNSRIFSDGDEPLECFPRSVTMYNLGLKKQKEQVVAVDFYQKKFEY